MLQTSHKTIFLHLLFLLYFSTGFAQVKWTSYASFNPGFQSSSIDCHTLQPVINKTVMSTGQVFAYAPVQKNNFKELSVAPAFAPPPVSVMKAEKKNILGMFLLLGYGKLRYNAYNESLYTMDNEFTLGGGATYEIPLEVFDGKFSVYNEMGFSLFKSQASLHYGDTIGGDPVNNYYDVNLTFSPNIVYLINTLRYTLTPGDFKYFVSLGISNSFVVSSTNTRETIHTRGGSSVRYVDEFVPDPNVHGITVPVSTGFSYRNIGFEIRFDPGRNFSNKLNYAIYMPAFDALLHVRFIPQ